MAALLYLPPSWLDHSNSTQGQETLQEIAAALGTMMVEVLEPGYAELLLTECVEEAFHTDWHWPNDARNGYLQMIYHHLSLLILSPAKYMIFYPSDVINAVAQTSPITPHPTPPNCLGLVSLPRWTAEAAGLLKLHDQHLAGLQESFFIGIPCSRAFSGGQCSTYASGSGERAFPMVGPNLDGLGSAYYWKVPPGIRGQGVPTSSAERHLPLLGATLGPKKKGSHQSVQFPGKRTWPLDHHYPMVPEPFLAQLVDLAERPLDYIKTVLITGEVPKRGELRLPGEYLPRNL